MLSAVTLSAMPLFISQAQIETGMSQFKSLEQVQMEALENQKTETLTVDQKRQKRLLRLTKEQNMGVNRVKSEKESFKKRSTRFSQNTSIWNAGISKTRSYRGSRALSDSRD